ncbi:MAG: TolC family protein [Planctomycetota bacterium]
MHSVSFRESKSRNARVAETAKTDLEWWLVQGERTLLEQPKWVAFDLSTVLVDTLMHSPLVQAVKYDATIRIEQIVQQDAAFDSRYVLDGFIGRTNDPVGNALVTGGPNRLNERSITLSGGVRRTGRSGTAIDLSQELGILDSNSQFFRPADQGNSRLSLSLTQPLMAGGGRVFNERLLVQARIDSRVSWQEMRNEVSDRIAEVMTTYWRLHEQRCQLIQQEALLERGLVLSRIIEGRSEFDVGPLELVKLEQRNASRSDTRRQLEASVKRNQARLRGLVGSETMEADADQTELIPRPPAEYPHVDVQLSDALRTAMENRPGIRSSMEELKNAALAIRVTKNQLMPRLDAVINAYLAGLNGRRQVFQSFGEQFYDSGPGISAGLQYELPRGNRFARSKHREAALRYRQRSSELQDQVQTARLEIETALIRIDAANQLRHSKEQTLERAVEEESILTQRYQLVGNERSHAALVLESVLESQQRRTDAEKALVAAQTEYHLALIELQRAMGTLLIHEGIQPMRGSHCNQIFFATDQMDVPLPRPIVNEEVVLDEPEQQLPMQGMLDASEIGSDDGISPEFPGNQAPRVFSGDGQLDLEVVPTPFPEGPRQ